MWGVGGERERERKRRADREKRERGGERERETHARSLSLMSPRLSLPPSLSFLPPTHIRSKQVATEALQGTGEDDVALNPNPKP